MGVFVPAMMAKEEPALYTHRFTQIDTLTHTHTLKHIHSHTHTHTHTHTHRHTHTHTHVPAMLAKMEPALEPARIFGNKLS
jgi:hypothetical protein